MAKRVSLPQPIAFAWDEGNLEHIKKHNVEYNECEEMFFDLPVYFYDEKHSLDEERYLAYGITGKERKLTLVFTIRENKVRVISARDQHKKERITYTKTKEGGEGKTK